MIRLSNYLFCLSIHFILILALYFTYVHYIFYRGYSWGLSRAKFKKNKKKKLWGRNVSFRYSFNSFRGGWIKLSNLLFKYALIRASLIIWRSAEFFAGIILKLTIRERHKRGRISNCSFDWNSFCGCFVTCFLHFQWWMKYF